MSTIETENGPVSQYVPFTPFQESYAVEADPSSMNPGRFRDTLAPRRNPPAAERYERKLWMRDLVMGVRYPPVDH